MATCELLTGRVDSLPPALLFLLGRETVFSLRGSNLADIFTAFSILNYKFRSRSSLFYALGSNYETTMGYCLCWWLDLLRERT